MKYIAIVISLLALIMVTSAIEINAHDAWYNKSAADYRNGSYYVALQYVNKSIELNPSDSESLNLKAAIFEKMGNFEAALLTLDDAIAANSSNIQAWNDKGLLQAGYLGDYNSSLKSLDKAIAIDPTRSTTYYNKGLVQEAMGKNDDAYQSFLKATDLMQSFVMAWYREGLILAKDGQVQ